MKHAGIGSVRNRLASITGALAGAALLLSGCGPVPTGDAPQDAQAPAATSRPSGVYLIRQAPELSSSQSAVGRSSSALTSSSTLSYYGGKVVSNIVVNVVFWTSSVNSTTRSDIGGFYSGVTNSGYFSWLTEYNTSSQSIGYGSLGGAYTITPSNTATTLSNSQIQTELESQINAGHLPKPTKDSSGNNNSYYAIYFPANYTITYGSMTSCASGGFCAYHSTYTSSTNGEYYYGVIADMSTGACNGGCGSNSNTFRNLTSVSSHEMIETVTDPGAGGTAWYDYTDNGEIGDLCNAVQAYMVGTNGTDYVVQQEFDNATHACILAKCGIMQAGDSLSIGQNLTSCDGRFNLDMQSDGNLVLYYNGSALWATGTNGKGGYVAKMQSDGNFVVYTSSGSPVWASGTASYAGAFLSLQDDGNLVVYKDATPHWSSGTCCH